MTIAPIPYITTLEDVYSDITEGIFPFITFVTVTSDGKGRMSQTIPFARFREMEDDPDTWDVRSCDCNGTICGQPTQHIYISKVELKDWYFVSQENKTHYVFIKQI